MPITSSAARRARRGSSPSASSASSAARSAFSDQVRGAVAGRGNVAKPTGDQGKAGVERLGPAPAGRALRGLRALLAKPLLDRACPRRPSPDRRARRNAPSPPRPPPRRASPRPRAALSTGASPTRLRARLGRAPRPAREARARCRTEGPRARATSPPHSRAALVISAAAIVRVLGGEPFGDRLRAERGEADHLAPRAHRFEQRRRLGRDQDDVREGRRLLERLQQGVLALLGHRVRLLDHEDPVIPLERPVRRRLDDPLANLIDQMLRSWRPEPREIRVR